MNPAAFVQVSGDVVCEVDHRRGTQVVQAVPEQADVETEASGPVRHNIEEARHLSRGPLVDNVDNADPGVVAMIEGDAFRFRRAKVEDVEPLGRVKAPEHQREHFSRLGPDLETGIRCGFRIQSLDSARLVTHELAAASAAATLFGVAGLNSADFWGCAPALFFSSGMSIIPLNLPPSSSTTRGAAMVP